MLTFKISLVLFDAVSTSDTTSMTRQRLFVNGVFMLPGTVSIVDKILNDNEF